MSLLTYTNGTQETLFFVSYSNGPSFASGTTFSEAVLKIVRSLKKRSSVKLFVGWSVEPGGRVSISGPNGMGDEHCSPREGQRRIYVT